MVSHPATQTPHKPPASTQARGAHHPLGLAARLREGVLRRKWLLRLLVWGAIALAWEVYGRRVGDFFFAPFSATIQGIGRLITSGDILVLGRSLQQMLVGYSIAVAIGVVVGLMAGALRHVGYIVRPYSQLVFVTSLEATLPFVIIVFGPGFPFRVAVVVLFSVFYIMLNVEAGVANVDPTLIETARSFRAPTLTIYREVVLPSALPHVVSGLRMGLGMAFKGMVVAELWVHTQTGALLFGYAQYRRLADFLALVLVLIVLGAAATQLLQAAERRLAPWAHDLGTGH